MGTDGDGGYHNHAALGESFEIIRRAAQLRYIKGFILKLLFCSSCDDEDEYRGDDNDHENFILTKQNSLH